MKVSKGTRGKNNQGGKLKQLDISWGQEKFTWQVLTQSSIVLDI